MTVELAVAGVMLAGPAFAQAVAGSAATGAETKGEQLKGSVEKPDSARSARSGRKGVMAMAGDEKVQAIGQLDTKTMHSLGVEVSTTSSVESTTSGSASPPSGSTTDTPKK